MSKDTMLDLTKGSPFALLVRFSMPMLVGNIFQTLYSMVDAAVLGRYVGSEALAAIGAAGSTTNMFVMVAGSFTGAVSVVVSQAVSSVLCFIRMFRKYEMLKITRGDFRPKWRTIVSITNMGSQMAFQGVLLGVGTMVITKVINGFGSDIVAAVTVGGNVQRLVTFALYGFVMSFSVYVGQNYGAKLYDRIRLGVRQMAGLTIILCVVAMAAALGFSYALAGLYIDPGATEITKAAVSLIRTQACFYLFLGTIELYNATVRGFGRISFCTASAVIELLMKVGCSILFAHLFGYTGIWYAEPVGWIIGILPVALYYHFGKWAAE